MLKEIGLLLKLKFSNFFGVKKAKTAKEKAVFVAVCVAMVLVFAVLCLYVGLMSYLFCLAGVGLLVPAVLCMVTTLILFFFTVVKAGSDLFDLRSYEMLAPLPLKKSSIIASKLLGTYITDALISLLIFISGGVGVVIYSAPSFGFYPMMIIGALLTPILPVCLASFIGAGVSALTSRLKNAKMVGSILLMLLSIAFIMVPYLIPEEMSEDVLLDVIKGLSVTIAGIYPPALWLSEGVWGINYLNFMFFVIISFAVCAVFVVVFAKVYKKVCTALSSVHNKKVKVDLSKTKASSPLVSLYKKEVKRLFSSSIYMMNTLTGNLMAIIICIALLFSGNPLAGVGIDISFIGIILVPIVGMVICMMPTTACAISIEGKNWDLLKSLPVSAKTVLGAKILLNMTFAVPCAIICSVALAVSPICAGVPIWYIFVTPIIYVTFMSIVSVVINAKAPTFNWSTETQVVKQSKSTLFCMLADFGAGIVCIVACVLAGLVGMIVTPIVLLAIGVILYFSLQKIELKKIV